MEMEKNTLLVALIIIFILVIIIFRNKEDFGNCGQNSTNMGQFVKCCSNDTSGLCGLAKQSPTKTLGSLRRPSGGSYPINPAIKDKTYNEGLHPLIKAMNKKLKKFTHNTILH